MCRRDPNVSMESVLSLFLDRGLPSPCIEQIRETLSGGEVISREVLRIVPWGENPLGDNGTPLPLLETTERSKVVETVAVEATKEFTKGGVKWVLSSLPTIIRFFGWILSLFSSF
jgi:hypothetical protein